ncbi:MAG TPA: aspartyl protease family protein [Terriglobales bacterium]|nr:aspartyl protease family protein [Terriglobales bacterium]
MSNFGWKSAGLLLVVVWGFSGLSEARVAFRDDAPSPFPVSEQVPFRLFRDYLIVVQGTLGDMAGRSLLIDTGADPTVVDRSVARRLGLSEKPSRLSQLNRDSRAASSVLPSLVLGPIRASSLPVLVADLSFVQRELGVRIDAIVGLDVLRSRNFAIDYQSKKIIFGELPISSDSVRFETAPPLVTVKMQLEGKPLRFLVDTGASGLTLFAEDEHPRGLPLVRVEGAENISGSFVRSEIYVSLHLGHIERRRQSAFLVQANASVQRNFDGLLSLPALGIKQVAFDFDRGVLSWR